MKNYQEKKKYYIDMLVSEDNFRPLWRV